VYVPCRVWDPYSFFTDPDPDPDPAFQNEYGSGSRIENENGSRSGLKSIF